MQITRESIFVGAIRSFCTAFAVLIGIFVAIAVGVILISLSSGTNLLPTKSEATIEPDADGNRKVLPQTDPAIVKINIHGFIGDGLLSSASIKDILLDSREDTFAHDRVKGILLHIDTPGGTVSGADEIYNEIIAYKKKYQVPVYAYVDGLCASGGMYIACACDKIYASPSSTIGSVGVIFGPAFNVAQAMEKIGIQSLTLSQGKDKDMLNPFRSWVPGEDDSLKAIIAALYQRFVNVVASARPSLDKQKLIEIYGAQVFLAEDAQKIGFIDDGNSSYEAALSALVKASGIPDKHPYQVFLLQRPIHFLESLFESKSGLLSGKITHRFEIGPYMTSDMSGKFLYLYQP